MNNICQSCAMKMLDESEYGKNKDRTLNEDYCMFCFEYGEFIEPNLTLEKQTQKLVDLLMMKLGLTEQKAIDYADETLPKLKRWK